MPVSRPVGGILFPGALRRTGSVTIHLCGLPEGCPVTGRTGRPCPLLGLAPGGGCPAAGVAAGAGALLPHRFTLACATRGPPSAVCSLLPCTVRSLRPGSRQHPALRSPDLPRPVEPTAPRSPGRLTGRPSVAHPWPDGTVAPTARWPGRRTGPLRAVGHWVGVGWVGVGWVGWVGLLVGGDTTGERPDWQRGPRSPAADPDELGGHVHLAGRTLGRLGDPQAMVPAGGIPRELQPSVAQQRRAPRCRSTRVAPGRVVEVDRGHATTTDGFSGL